MPYVICNSSSSTRTAAADGADDETQQQPECCVAHRFENSMWCTKVHQSRDSKPAVRGSQYVHAQCLQAQDVQAQMLGCFLLLTSKPSSVWASGGVWRPALLIKPGATAISNACC